LAWSIVILSVFVVVLGLFLWSWLRGLMNQPVVASDIPELKTHKVLKFQSPGEEAVVALVKSALESRESPQAADYFHMGEAGPGELVGFLSKMIQDDGPVIGFQWLGGRYANGQLIENVLITCERDGKPRERVAMLVPDDQGVWKIDFEAFARMVRPSWELLLGESGGRGLVRVFVRGDNYFNGPFRDDAEWSCYAMASPDIDQMLLGYCRKGSPQDEAMMLMLLRNAKEGQATDMESVMRATLLVERPQGADARQFEITRVLAEDWIVSDNPYDGERE
jgi:hypothetical protein